jgi:hypothetical protein
VEGILHCQWGTFLGLGCNKTPVNEEYRIN